MNPHQAFSRASGSSGGFSSLAAGAPFLVHIPQLTNRTLPRQWGAGRHSAATTATTTYTPARRAAWRLPRSSSAMRALPGTGRCEVTFLHVAVLGITLRCPRKAVLYRYRLRWRSRPGRLPPGGRALRAHWPAGRSAITLVPHRRSDERLDEGGAPAAHPGFRSDASTRQRGSLTGCCLAWDPRGGAPPRRRQRSVCPSVCSCGASPSSYHRRNSRCRRRSRGASRVRRT